MGIDRHLHIVMDMHGCPNRCLHCWLGELPNGLIADEEAERVVDSFKPYFKDVTFYSWLREPDFMDGYRERWERDCAISRKKPERFELASFWRIARDPDYVSFLKEVGVKKVQLTFFGGEKTTDRYVGRSGAYQELLKATSILKENGIEPRWQFFVNMENKDEIYSEIQLGESLGAKEIFVHEGSCDGNNRKLYGIRIEKGAIPKELIPYYLEYESLLSEAECCVLLKGSKEHFLPHNEKDIVLNVTSDMNAYFNFTHPSYAWCLGNLRDDPVEDIVRKAVEEDVPSLRLSKLITLGELVERYGDPTSQKVFSLDDYKMYLLNKYLDEVHNLPHAIVDMAKKVKERLK